MALTDFQQLLSIFPLFLLSKKYAKHFCRETTNKKRKKLTKVEFKEFEPRPKFETKLKYCWLNLNINLFKPIKPKYKSIKTY